MTAGIGEWYRGRRVFLTGHTGFKGSWLATWLKERGAIVTGYALAPETGRPSLYEIGDVESGMTSHIGDIRDRDTLDRILKDARPELVFHLAAQSLVRRSYAEPVDTFATNVMGTVQLLDALRHIPSARAVVVVTSDKCYENRDLDRGYREDDPMGGYDPYSASKGCQELTTAAFRRSFLQTAGVAVATARAGNVIGGGDWSEDRLIADLMLGAAAGHPATLRNPDAVRPWQFVLEPLRGYLMLGRALVESGMDFAEGWNFGPDLRDAVSVREVAAHVAKAWPDAAPVLAPPGAALHEARVLRLDNSKARERLGWKPVLTLRDAVTMTVNWYREVNADRSSGHAMMQQQLADHETRVAAAVHGPDSRPVHHEMQ